LKRKRQEKEIARKKKKIPFQKVIIAFLKM